MINYKKWNTILGWCFFVVATIVYFITIEDTVSLWDCGEYITAAYKLEVGHPPGAPLFMAIGRLFSFFAEPTQVAVWINRLSALSSSLTILFMFWSLTLLIKKLILNKKEALSNNDVIAIFVSAGIGSLAYTFTDSFWFSAVEGEVYAMASLFTAAIFWSILKWDEEMEWMQKEQSNTSSSPHRWLLLIMFLLGLAIGVHLLGILVIPSIGYFIYFRYTKNVTLKGIIITGILAVFILGFIQEGVIPGSIAMASSFEVAFVNSIGLPFYSGSIFFFALLIFVCLFITRYAKRKNNTILHNSMMGLIMLLIGYGSFAIIVIRSNANPPLDENDPENLVTLKSYLKREQYGSAPIFFGQYWNSELNDREQWNDRDEVNLRRFVIVNEEGVDIKAFQNEKEAKKYAKNNSAEVVEKYYVSNASVRENSEPTYSQTTFFPRMYYSGGSAQDKQKMDGYKKWSGYDANDEAETEIGNDGLRLPTFGENLAYFFNYQLDWMYWRYLMWNFSGRQNDIQGHGDAMRGNWKTGISSIDNLRLGDQENAPFYTSNNKSNNSFFMLPFIFGLIGLIFHFYKSPKDAFSLLLAFLFTGVMIVIYLNQKPFEPRERDYAYAGSFYFFAFWIGFGVYALIDFFRHFDKQMAKKIGVFSGGILFLTLLLDRNAPVGMPATLTWIYIVITSSILVGLMLLLKKIKAKEIHSIVVAGTFGLCIPILMAFQGWDDHDRSNKSSARDLSYNYLNSCSKNAILFTNGDNDTFPLWYMQEVEGERTDVRVCNLSLMQTDWYTNQMKMKAYKSDPLPIKFREDQILMYAGQTDQVMFMNLARLFDAQVKPEVIQKIISLRLKNKSNVAKSFGIPSFTFYKKVEDKSGTHSLVQQGLEYSPDFNKNKNRDYYYKPQKNGDYKKVNAVELFKSFSKNEDLSKYKSTFLSPIKKDSVAKSLFEHYQALGNIFTSIKNNLQSQEDLNALKLLNDFVSESELVWNKTSLEDVMAFVRNDDNIVTMDANTFRVFPTDHFQININKKHVISSGIVSAKQEDLIANEISFDFINQTKNINYGGLTREEVMMLDVLANNQWKRGVYFSSPGGSEVSKKLISNGHLADVGLAHVISPLKITNSKKYFMDVKYNNLMKKYKYGEMFNDNVLTDYYARRHTNQFRRFFYSLADEYLKEENNKENQNKAINLLKKSLQVMPPNIVIDGGEPGVSGERYMTQYGQISFYIDGNLANHVNLFYKAKATKEAEKLGLTVLEQKKKTLNYFIKSHPHFSYTEENIPDLMASVYALFQLYEASKNSSEDSKNSLHKKVTKTLKDLYSKQLPKLYKKIDGLKTNEEEDEDGSNSFMLKVRMDTLSKRFKFDEQAVPKKPNLANPIPNVPASNNVGEGK